MAKKKKKSKKKATKKKKAKKKPAKRKAVKKAKKKATKKKAKKKATKKKATKKKAKKKATKKKAKKKATKKKATKKKAKKKATKKAAKPKTTKKKAAKKEKPKRAKSAKPAVRSIEEIALDVTTSTVANPFAVDPITPSPSPVSELPPDDLELGGFDSEDSPAADYKPIEEMVDNDIETEEDLMDEPEVAPLDLEDVNDEDEEGYF